MAPRRPFLLDRHWDMRMTNQAASRCTRFLLGAEPSASNMLRLVLRPDLLRPVMVNWEEMAGDLIRHLHNQVAASPKDERAQRVLEELLAYPGVPARWRTREIGAPTTPLLTTIFRKGQAELRFFSTFTTFGTPHDVALEELRVECSLPADAATAATCRKLFGS